MPSPGWLQATGFVQAMIMGTSTAVAGIVLNESDAPFLLLALAIICVSVLVHEGGHVLGARLGGMDVMRVDLGIAQVLVAKRVRWRWKRCGALAVASLDPDRPIRRQMLPFIWGGPLANAGMAGLCGVVAWIDASEFISAMAVFNMGLAVSNLLPTHRKMASDGLLLLRLYRGMDEREPALLYLRALGLARRGRDVDADFIPRLARSGAPWSAIAVSWDMHQHAVRGDWDGALALVPEMESLLDAPQMRGDFTDLAKAFLRFVRGMAGVPMEPPLDPRGLREMEWWSPGIVSRIEALDVLRDTGDVALVRAKLAASEAAAARSHDDAHIALEAAYREAILNRLPAAVTG